MKAEITKQIGTEIQSVLSRQTDDLMEGIGAISSIKSTVELCHSSLSSNSEYLNEVAEAVHQGSTGIKDKLDSIGQDLATAKTNRESINLSELSSAASPPFSPRT